MARLAPNHDRRLKTSQHASLLLGEKFCYRMMTPGGANPVTRTGLAADPAGHRVNSRPLSIRFMRLTRKASKLTGYGHRYH
jgi:hypothetical protein